LDFQEEILAADVLLEGQISLEAMPRRSWAALKDQKIQNVDLIGSDAKLEWRQDAEGLRVEASLAMDRYVYLFRLDLQAESRATMPNIE
jgi:hypothetical protein